MILDLTPEQARQWEQHRACVVPGDQWPKMCPHADPTECSGEHCDCPLGPPEQFRVANEPCPTCGGKGWAWSTIAGFPAHHVKSACPDCRGGKPVVELRVPFLAADCDTCEEDHTTSYHDKFDHAQYHGGKDGFVPVARATVTLLPVKPWASHIDTPEGTWVALGSSGRLNEQSCDGYHLATRPLGITFHPAPLPGRDWVAMFATV